MLWLRQRNCQKGELGLQQMLSRILSAFAGVYYFLIYEDSHCMYAFLEDALRACVGMLQNSIFDEIMNDIA